jgi:predicted amidohydrolase
LADGPLARSARSNPLRIAAVQPPCVSYDIGGNAATHAEVIRSARARVVVFPELSLTGYELDAPAVSIEDPRLASIIEACAQTGSLALAGAPVQGEASRAHIGMLAVDGGGARVAYRKMWLGPVESVRFAPGEEPGVLEVDGWRLGLAVCKDTGVERHAADTAALGMDVYVAGLLEHAEDTGVLEERARRVGSDHGAWVVFASFAGSTGGGYDRAAGRSGVWAADATEVDRAGTEPGSIARATLQPSFV